MEKTKYIIKFTMNEFEIKNIIHTWLEKLNFKSFQDGNGDFYECSDEFINKYLEYSIKEDTIVFLVYTGERDNSKELDIFTDNIYERNYIEELNNLFKSLKESSKNIDDEFDSQLEQSDVIEDVELVENFKEDVVFNSQSEPKENIDIVNPFEKNIEKENLFKEYEIHSKNKLVFDKEMTKVKHSPFEQDESINITEKGVSSDFNKISNEEFIRNGWFAIFSLISCLIWLFGNFCEYIFFSIAVILGILGLNSSRKVFSIITLVLCSLPLVILAWLILCFPFMLFAC